MGSADGGRGRKKQQAAERAPAANPSMVTIGQGPASAAAGHAVPFEAFTPDGLWALRGFLDVLDGHLVVSELYVAATGTTPPLGITSSTLRSIPIGRILATGQQRVQGGESLELVLGMLEKAGALSGELHRRTSDVADKAAAAAKTPDRKRGRPGRPDQHYRMVAVAYLKLQEQGAGRGILLKLAGELGQPRDTVRDWVQGATKRGYLTPGTRGRAGRSPGPNLKTDTEEKELPHGEH